jgi:hypothetical protein
MKKKKKKKKKLYISRTLRCIVNTLRDHKLSQDEEPESENEYGESIIKQDDNSRPAKVAKNGKRKISWTTWTASKTFQDVTRVTIATSTSRKNRHTG